MILNALGGPVIIEKFYPHTVINAETGVVTYPEKCYFYEGFTVDPVPQSVLDEAYLRGYNSGYESGYDSGYEAGVADAKPYARELEYLESSGTQYVDCNFALTGAQMKSFKITIDASFLNTKYSVFGHGETFIGFLGTNNPFMVGIGGGYATNNAYTFE